MLNVSTHACPSSAFGVGVLFGLYISVDKGEGNKESLPVPPGPHRISGVCVQRTIDKANNYSLIFHLPFFLPNSCKKLCSYGRAEDGLTTMALSILFLSRISFLGFFLFIFSHSVESLGKKHAAFSFLKFET